MKVTLVQPPSAYRDVHDLAPPLGLLTLAAVLEAQGHQVSIVDLNLKGLTNPVHFESDFMGHALHAIAACEPQVVGFTSMALESHTCVRLAQGIKRQLPQVKVVMGGPHFSSAALQFMTGHPSIDYVVTGEGEHALPSLLQRIDAKRSMLGLKNVAFRIGNDVHLDRELRPAASGLELPFPAYHLIRPADYFAVNPRRLADFEHARGCALRCSFCYSATQWGQGDRSRQVDRVIDDMRRLRKLGFRHLFFVGDNFLNSKEAASTLCRAIEEADLDLTWDGYATLAQLTPTMIDDLARSRCTSLFVGVDAVSNASKALFHKTYYKGWDKLSTVLSNCLAHGITPTCSFLIDHPQRNEQTVDHSDTDDALMTALLSQKLGCGVRLNSLAIYNDTELDQKELHTLRPTTLRAKYFFDTFDINIENEFAAANPRLYPLHNTMLDVDDEDRYVKVLFVAFQLFTRYPNTLYRYLVDGRRSAWETMVLIATRVDEWDHNKKPQIKQSIVHEFDKLIHESTTPFTVFDAYRLEQAEQSLMAGVEERKKVVNIVNSTLSYEERCERLVSLSTNPVLLESVKSLTDCVSDAQDYLLTLSDGEMSYFKVKSAAEFSGTERAHVRRGHPPEISEREVDHAFSP